jgi:hypothetical protein
LIWIRWEGPLLHATPVALRSTVLPEQEKGPAIAGPFLIDATAVYLAA